MSSAFDIIGLVLVIISISELFKLALRFLAGRLSSARWQKVEKALQRIDEQLQRFEHSRSLREEAAERREINRLTKQLDDLSQDVRELRESAVHLRTRLLQLEMPGNSLGLAHTTTGTQRPYVPASPPQADADLAPGPGPSSRPQQVPLLQSSRVYWNETPVIRSSSLPSTSPPQQASADVASGIEYVHRTDRELHTQSQATWKTNPAPALPSVPQDRISHRATAATRRQRRPSSPQNATTNLVWDVQQFYPAYEVREFATWLPNPADQLSPPLQDIGYWRPRPGPGLFGERSPPLNRSSGTLPDPEPLAPRSPTGSTYRD